MGKVYVGDVGLVLLLDCDEDLTSATDLAVNVLKPDGSKVTWVPTVYATTKLRYIIAQGDLDQVGEYRLQPSLTLPNGWSGLAETAVLQVTQVYN